MVCVGILRPETQPEKTPDLNSYPRCSISHLYVWVHQTGSKDEKDAYVS